MNRLSRCISVLAVFCTAASLWAATPAAVAAASDAIVVAHDGSIDVFDRAGTSLLWRAPGALSPSFAVSGETQVAVVDPLNDAIRLVDLDRRTIVPIATGATPIDARFSGGELFVLERDASQLTCYRSDGTKRGAVALAADPAFLRSAAGLLYVYSRAEGVLQEISPIRLEVIRKVTLPPAASDFEIDSSSGYLAYPREGKVRTFARETLATTGEMPAGAVPVDLAFAGAPNALSARKVAIADPSSSRVWVVEGRQSVAQAFFRGFLRGFIGLGSGAKNPAFPTGVDRVVSVGSRIFAYDSSSGTLYRVDGKNAAAVASSVSPGGFAPAGDTLAVWSDGRVRLLR